MKLQTIKDISEDGILSSIKELEANGFFLHLVGFNSKAPRTHHITRAAQKRRRDSTEERKAFKRARWRRQQGTLKGKWKHMKRTLNSRAKTQPSYAFLISYPEWVMLWRKAGKIALGDGSEKLAWQARGRDTACGWGAEPQRPQLRRWDVGEPYTLGNVYVQYKKQVLADGELIAEQIAIAEREINEEKEFENNA